ncbi:MULTISPECIES: DUF2273 domain-containing protein [Enterococcus]|uniref:DUF2273 domain-containing protein n=1 Tax=Enterococcus alcedinis TaxID=1274384 RepID=A0A917JE86_9ENTE|nr:DUF2273 domain-containing protein [Enterococcus alcedinis]MBP2101360.1 putative membrane protein [Enterococcus alcedinis]GGI65248.1 hypothetical protein GCM10011482_09020 [Enterococcus alcedinis]
MKNIIEDYKLPIIGGSGGLLIGVSIVSFGFFKTLFVLLLVGIGLSIGYYIQQQGMFDK